MTTILIRRGATVLFHDDFSSGDLSHTQGGASWAPNFPLLVQANTVNPMPGRTHSVQFQTGAGPNDVELRLGTLTAGTSEIYLEWYVYFPDGNEVPSVGPRVETPLGQTQNDKWFRGWGNTNGALGQPPAVNTIGAQMWTDTLGGYKINADVAGNGTATTITAYTNLAIDAADSTKITSTPTLSQYTSLVIPPSTGFPGGTYLVNSVAAGVATMNASVGSVSASGGTGTGYLNNIAPGQCGPQSPLTPGILGLWTRYRVYSKMATIANNDGVIKVWLNSTLITNQTAMSNYATQFGPTKFSNFYFFGAQNSTIQVGRMLYFADFTASLGGFIG